MANSISARQSDAVACAPSWEPSWHLSASGTRAWVPLCPPHSATHQLGPATQEGRRSTGLGAQGHGFYIQLSFPGLCDVGSSLLLQVPFAASFPPFSEGRAVQVLGPLPAVRFREVNAPCGVVMRVLPEHGGPWHGLGPRGFVSNGCYTD